MPSACNSGYDDWPNFATGYYWQEFLFEELMPMIYHWLPASEARDDNYIAGLSMGGRGALKMMLAHPEKFKAGAMLSSFPMKFEDDCILQKVAAMSDAEKACLKQKLMQPVDGMSEEFRMGRCLNYLEMFGSYEAYYNSQENTWRSLKESVIKQDLPAMYFACGTEDFMYDRYHSFQEYAAKIGLHAVFEEGPGRHEWRFWKKYIQNALEFFNIGAEKQGNIY
jgi:putative tributyrin esterase